MARRRPPPEPKAVNGIPPELAAGPDVTRWATTDQLDTVRATRGTPAARDAVEAAMLTARTRWRDAVTAWGESQGLDHQSTWGSISSRRPYWPT